MTTTLEQLLEEIAFKRRKDLRSKSGTPLASAAHLANHNTTYWTDLFVRHFLFQTDYEVDRDDLLFFIRKGQRSKPQVDVFRRDSRKLPIGDPDVDWEETIYLNLIVHHLNYKITLAVYSRTSHKDIQVLRRYTQKVYATPSRRQMDGKGDYEEITYPYVCFTVDNFDEIFSEVCVRDGESIGIELTAEDPSETLDLVNTVLFSASVPYEALKRVYESRASQTVRKRLSQTNLFSLFSGMKGNGPRMEYVRLVGLDKGRGHAELAVSKTKDAYSTGWGGCDTPSSEPGTDLLDLWDSDAEDPELSILYPPINSQPENHILGFKKTHQRRLSDPSNTLNDFIRMGLLERPGASVKVSQSTAGSRAVSESDGLDTLGEASCEILAGDLLDEFEETAYNPLWTMKGHTQIFHHWRESKRVQCIPVGTFVTYVMLPWWSIVKNVLDQPKRPVLTF